MQSLRALSMMLATLLLSLHATHAAVDSAITAEKHATHSSTADHSKFEGLQKAFASGPEVTQACIECHTEASHQVMQSNHWTWEFTHPETGQVLGKKNVINAFCGNVASNEPRCTSCHAGYGWTDMGQPPPQDETHVDCLVCHDTTGTYKKLPAGAGHPQYETVVKKGKVIEPPDLSKIAQSVALPQRENCGACHFFGGGADNVKHGDLSTALLNPSPHVDVHMSPDGENFSCSSCHVSHEHQWAGSRYAVHATDPEGTGKPGERRDVATCESCHGNKPHPGDSLDSIKLNNHTEKVACQTCHIPEFAKGGVATKTVWDWSTAGKMKEGKPYSEENYTQGNGKHLHTYMSKKGDFEYGEDVVPHYAWFDGQVRYTLAGDKIDPSERVEINSIKGSSDDGHSRIWPFKRMEGRQAYDKVNNTLVFNKVFGPESDTAFWKNFDWEKSIKAGMEAVGLPYSGEYGFVDTYMYWPITHMVSPKDEALACNECHAKNGRLEGVEGVYLPGRDGNVWLDRLGILLIAATLLGVIGHGLIRIVLGKGGKH